MYRLDLRPSAIIPWYTAEEMPAGDCVGTDGGRVQFDTLLWSRDCHHRLGARGIPAVRNGGDDRCRRECGIADHHAERLGLDAEPDGTGGANESHGDLRGLLFWSWMWGIWGTLLAVPIVMVIKVVSDHVEELQPLGDFLGE